MKIKNIYNTSQALIASLFITFTIAGCISNGVPMMGTGISGAEGLTDEQVSFAKFKDIPIPEGSKMSVQETIIFGSSDEWFGRLTILSNYNHAQAFDYFKYEMPNFKWKEITTVRSESSVLTYENQNRIATIQITSNSIGKSKCAIIISPKEE